MNYQRASSQIYYCTNRAEWRDFVCDQIMGNAQRECREFGELRQSFLNFAPFAAFALFELKVLQVYVAPDFIGRIHKHRGVC